MATASQRRRALYRFRAAVRLAMVNRHWLMKQEDITLGLNFKRNIALITRRKGERGILSIKDKALLRKSPEDRTPNDRRHLVVALSALKCLSRFSPKVRSRLAKVCFYAFYEFGRVIVKEGHRAVAMYFILDGEIVITKKYRDPETNEDVDQEMGILPAGDIFGEVALLENNVRTATFTANTNVELLFIYYSEFDKILRETLQSQWDQVRTAVSRFDIFKNWAKSQIRECCILSKIREYDPLQIIYYEDEAIPSFVHFVLSGDCSILQCLKVQSIVKNGKKKYNLCNVSMKRSSSNEIMTQINEVAEEIYNSRRREHETTNNDTEEDVCLNPKPDSKPTMDFIYESISKKMRAVDISEIFEKDDNSKKSVTNIEHHFIDVGTLTSGAIFGLGEPMQHRIILAKTTVQCLLIPRYWLFQKAQNIANIWRQTQIYLEATIPSRDALFADFLTNRRWRRYKKDLIEKLISKQGRNVSPTKIEDIPIICRIIEASD